MSDYGPEHRSFERITKNDLKRLAHLAELDRAAFFSKYPEWAKLYKRRIIATALCQGAALHYLDRKTGIHDFDIFTFYAEVSSKPWFARRRQAVDFGRPKFGTSIDAPHFLGRRVDMLGRSLNAEPNDDPAQAIRNWLSTSTAKTPRLLSEKAIILLSPEARLGEVVWPLSRTSCKI